ncbi:helix-turn-helix domain-containing protein [Vibrio sagamiensis]|uniref:AraC family transcriptional regulator n=1 Tax=Vibrio sagamiensis NBRC 104589 TaxID=1219064 RepID=A0A511QE19_9VIBR|nr:helix-turn-helix transcriptional regulator [Vibrio sagamiensis]PNQ54133.1 AraC family transcriptional regulator [Vibrio agarivorans]GEM75545.1 AraC family transcriptional regulator [Vibrio sagamiensis NBRC 104589]
MDNNDHRVITRIYDSQFSCDFHQHDFAHFIYVHQGCHILYTDEQSIMTTPGNLIYVPAYNLHRVEVLTQSRISFLCTLVQPKSKCKSIQLFTVTPLVTQLFQILENQKLEGSLEQHYIQVLADQTLQCEPASVALVAQGCIDRRLLMIIDSLSKEPNIKISLSDLASTTGASVRTLNRLFLNHFNASFKDIRSKVVMDRAEQLLNQGMSSTDVAYELQYSSLSAFSNAFKEHQKKKTLYQALQ